MEKDDFETPRDVLANAPIRTLEDSNSLFSPPTTKPNMEKRPEWVQLSNSAHVQREANGESQESKQKQKESGFAKEAGQPQFDNKKLASVIDASSNRNLGLDVMPAQGEDQLLHNQVSMLAQNVEALNLENASLRRLVRQNSGNLNSRTNSKMRKLASLEQEPRDQVASKLTDSDIFQIIVVQAKALEKCIDTL